MKSKGISTAKRTALMLKLQMLPNEFTETRPARMSCTLAVSQVRNGKQFDSRRS
jgi:hypothetical protein